jgi:prolipoprotein diacylglyceryltransferase
MAGSALLITGVGRIWLELYFRPDQPSFFGLGVSTSLVVCAIFALVGLFIILVKMGKIRVPFMQPGALEYNKRVVHQRRAPVRKTRRKKA